jgi:methyl-CpG-binding domain protein 4
MTTPDIISPWSLLQEELQYDPWKVLIACKMLNLTNYKQVRKVIFNFFKKWPDPVHTSQAKQEDMALMLKPLGFYNRRSKQIIRFSKEYLEKKWNDPIELYGVGKYAADSYKIFILRSLDVEPTDKKLIRYVNWAKNRNCTTA